MSATKSRRSSLSSANGSPFEAALEDIYQENIAPGNELEANLIKEVACNLTDVIAEKRTISDCLPKRSKTSPPSKSRRSERMTIKPALPFAARKAATSSTLHSSKPRALTMTTTTTTSTLRTVPAVALRTTAAAEAKKAATKPQPKSFVVKASTIKLTVPKSPNFQTNRRAAMQTKTSTMSRTERESYEAEKLMEAEKQRVSRAKKAFEKFKVRSKQPVPTSKTVRSAKPLTIPETPVSRLSRRHGPKLPSAVSAPSVQQPAPTKVVNEGPAKPTIPEPFKFETDKRLMGRSVEFEEKPEVVTMKEAEMKVFYRDARSHSVPTHVCEKLTQPKSPFLRTVKRRKTNARPLPQSRAEQEDAMMKEFEEKQFRARPINEGVFTKPKLHTNSFVAPKKLTTPAEFHFRSDERALRRKSELNSSKVTPQKTEPFRARAMHSKAGELPQAYRAGTSAPQTRVVKRMTIAASPQFAGGRRASAAPAHRQKPHHTIAEQIRREEEEAVANAYRKMTLKLTEPKEFSFRVDQRGEAAKCMLEDKVLREEAAASAAREMHAKPAPEFSKPFLPMPSNKPLTKPEGFDLRSVDLHIKAEMKLQEELAEEEKRLQAEFHALPLPSTTYHPEEIKLPEHELLMPLEVVLETSKRPEQRREFEKQREEIETEKKENKEAQAKAKLDEENMRIRALRRTSAAEGGMLFKANPIITKDMYPTKGPIRSMPLTEPKSPNLLTATRVRSSLVSEALNNF